MKLLLLLLAAATAVAADCSHSAPCDDCLTNPACIYYETQDSGRFCTDNDDLPHLQKIYSLAKCPSQPESEDPVDFSMTRLGSGSGSTPTPDLNDALNKKDLESTPTVSTTTPSPTTTKETMKANDAEQDNGLPGQSNAEELSTTQPTVGEEEEEEEADGKDDAGNNHDHVGEVMIHARISNGNSTVVLRSSVQGALTAQVNDTLINLRFHSSGTKSAFNFFSLFAFLFFIL